MSDTQGTTRAPEGASNTATMVYAGAIPVTSVPCPDWCNVSQQEHLESLFDTEGRPIHFSSTRNVGQGEVSVSASTFADGSPTEGRNSRVHSHMPGDWDEGMAVEDARAFAQAILTACELLEEGQQ